jgi:ATP-binding cassette, subfamily B, bacterial MsbA
VRSLQRLLPYLKPYRATMVMVVFFGIIMAATTAFLPALVKMLFDDVFQKKDESLKYWVPLGLVAIYFVHALSRFIHLYLLKYTAEKVVAEIRSDLQKKFMTLNLGFHNTYGAGSGGLLSRVLNDVTILQWGLQIVVDLIREPVTAAFLLVALLRLNWQLTLVMFVIAPPIVILIQSLAKSIRKYSLRQQETMEDFTSTLKETLDGVRIIQSFNLEKEMNRRFESVGTRYLENRRKVIAREESAGPISEFLSVCLVAGLCIYVTDLIFAEKMTAGTFIGFLTALAQFNPVFKKVQDAYLRLQPTEVASERLFEILDNTNEVPQEKSKKPFPSNWDSIEFKNVSFAYGERPILRNINLSVKRGEIIALVGESGSGKSTVVNLLGRFFDPSSGEILIGGIPIDEIDLKDLRNHIALVTQEVFLFNDTVTRNIQAGDFERPGDGVSFAAKVANAHDFIVRSENMYETKIGDRGARFSGGEKQRLSIARAVYKDAPILILDEATSALDSASEIEVQKGLDKLMEGRTAFVIAHRLSTVVKADRILVLKDGQIVEEGQHEGLIAKNGHYHKFYKLQSF